MGHWTLRLSRSSLKGAHGAREMENTGDPSTASRSLGLAPIAASREDGEQGASGNMAVTFTCHGDISDY